MRFFQNASYPFLEWRKRAYIATALMLLVGIGAMAAHTAAGRAWLNYGIDFTGGTVVQVRFKQAAHAEDVRAAAVAAGHGDWEITQFGGANEFEIRTPSRSFSQEAGRDAQSRVKQAMGARFGAQNVTIARTEAVGPRAGAELQRNALWAILLSFAVTLIYLWIRFEWRFSLAAIIATAHDIVITLGFLALTRTEVSLGTVAAVLTVVGYSMHDTIIVFDRVREDLQKPRGGRTFIAILDKAINETLPRTILTVGTVLATLLALLFFGGPVIYPFALVMVVGISIGTFSSVFVASPVLYEIQRRWPRKEPKREQAAQSTSRSREAA
ncbi:MAG TPA: protein translocase subunit SecF, partial [Longimicrobium sp.]